MTQPVDTAPVDLATVRERTAACAGVVAIHGRGANGVSADDAEVEVHVVAEYGIALPDLAERLDATLAPLLAGRTLTVVVEDVRDPDAPTDPTDSSSGGPADGDD